MVFVGRGVEEWVGERVGRGLFCFRRDKWEIFVRFFSGNYKEGLWFRCLELGRGWVKDVVWEIVIFVSGIMVGLWLGGCRLLCNLLSYVMLYRWNIFCV